MFSRLVRITRGLALVASVMLGSQSSHAQDGVKRTDIQTHDLSIPGREVVQQWSNCSRASSLRSTHILAKN